MNLRNFAAQVLLRVLKDGRSLTSALDASLDKIPENKDKAFVQALCYGVCREYYRLDFMLQQLLEKPLRTKDLDIRLLLLLGLYQLQYMRVKPHAAVSETVAAAGKKSWAKSLVNGVLRRFIREQTTLLQSADNDKMARCSHPQWMYALFEQCWPEHVDDLVTANDQPAPMVLRVNLRQGSREDYLNELSSKDMPAEALDFCSTAIVLDQPVDIGSLPGFAEGKVSVQDTAAQLAAELLNVQPGHSVLDLCAAPGGKTAAILERQPKVERCLAVDIDEVRMKKVRENLDRLQLQAETLVADASDPETWAVKRQFDRILLDAPCSALGVIRRHPDIKLLRRESDIAELQKLQNKILNAAWTLLRPGGVLLYATCSVLKQENEWQIESFLQQHDDAEEVVIDATWGQARPFGRQILTGTAQMDGFYYARLRKVF